MRTSRLLTCVLAVSALVLGTVVPAAAAQASVSAPVARVVGASTDLAATGIAKSTLVGFTPGNIISDVVFTNKSTMTEAQIQTFFNSKVSKCQGGRDENNEAIVCLKDFRMNTVTRPADQYCTGYTGAANESAARIIYRVSQACNINPQVLIVMLQKEQGLVTHIWPSAWRYRIALGQGCPDTAPCDPNYIGFFHQIYGAARQMQIYMEGKWFQWYAPGKTWNILYNPNASCGSAPVRVANKATSALYYYTPYQPNAAALRAGYGTGDGCSAYGNRNFYNYFTDWFGSTQGTPATAPPVISSANTSSFVVGADAAGTVWAYPFAKKVWGTRVQMATGLGNVKAFFGVGDLTGDGNRDFLSVDATGQPSALYGDGTTKLSAPTRLGGNWSGTVLVVPAGDFNGDGLPDVFTTDASGALYLRAGDGRGGFGAAKLIGSGWTPMSMLVGGLDMNGDGRSDLIARDSTGRLFLYQGDGRGGWGPRSQIGSGWSGMTSIFSPGDFTGNGTPDLLAHTADGVLMAYEGRSTSFVAGVGTVGSGWQNLSVKSSAGPAVTRPRALPAGFGDVDGAGGNDVVALTNKGELRLYGGSGTGTWRSSSVLATGWGATDRIVSLGDFTGDGRADLGRIDGDGIFSLLPATGSGFGKAVRIGHGWGPFVHIVGGVDFDGDRKPDVIAVSADGTMTLYRGNGSGGFQGDGAQIGKGWGVVDLLINAGDFTGDGRSDLLARTSDGALRLYPTTGGGGFGAMVQIGKGWGGMKQLVGPGDFNGDGSTDVLAIRQDGAMILYPGNGKGGWGASAQIGSGWQSISSLG
ncbi:VCBS repeat-containing protein [Microbacterium sp. NPDC028030]|uniref:FG-GAP repeat domain-containing protein n=1 Tax=Microbacterium sp. NPDC028030 TaxID=3155124 RepID=UPI0033F5D082